MTVTNATWADNLPQPAKRNMALHVTPAAERAIRGGHPWLFDQSIRRRSRDGRSGDLAVIFDRKDRFLAVGLYDPDSSIRVRILQQGEPARIDQGWFERQIRGAVERRRPLLASGSTTGCRLIHGENDGLPGLVVDRYDETCVMKLYTTAWLPHLRPVVAALETAVQPRRLVLRLSRALQNQPEQLYGLTDGMVLQGPALTGPVLFQENGLTFAVDVVAGQKTGFFLDQRDNRARVETLAAGKRVLNVFAYTGGFSLYAARGGATAVTSLDLSQPALETAAYNFQLNSHLPAVASARHELLQGDAFQLMEELVAQKRPFDLVIVDPPSFARQQAETERALAAYARLTRLALRLLTSGGILVQASCSSRVETAEFFQTIHKTALKEKRLLRQAQHKPLREIERTGHPLDHPIGFPEGEYLKCLFAVV
jgi:23S rRNA (cytosine1962-C5)-methyltransferase